MKIYHVLVSLVVLALLVSAVSALPVSAAPNAAPPQPKFSTAVAFDMSPALRDVAKQTRSLRASPATEEEKEVRPDRGPTVNDKGFSGDGAIQGSSALRVPAASVAAATIASPLLTFEGLSNQDNFNIFGFRVNPPDPNGAVGPNHYVEMVNLVFAVYDKQGNRLLGPVDTGTLWSGFAINDCTDPSGDPIVLYDQIEDRWLLSQFTTRGPEYWNCVALSQTGDPTGAYYRYAFSTGLNFPDYPKYSVWTDSYVITTREFGPTIEYGIGVYALEKNKMVNGQPDARVVSFFLNGNDPAILPLVGDGLLPADIDGKQKPKNDATIPLVGTQDDGASYGATLDALNIWELSVKWRSTPIASVTFQAQLAVASFDSIFPCGGNPGQNSRDCLPQPGVAPTANNLLDILSYRQRPTYRLAYRNFGTYEALVTTQSVEAAPRVAGMRWYEIRRTFPNPQPNTPSQYSVYQQGTYAPNDGVHRWMGSVAMDWQGNMALGYSVVNGTNVFPGIRYTGRLKTDPLGTMNLGEGTIINGSGIQRTSNSRWGDYSSLNVDPVDDCTFWYVNEYYTLAGQQSSTAGWQTRIGSFKLPGCKPRE